MPTNIENYRTMKPLKQIEDFLIGTKIKSENDWLLIKSFCDQNYNQELKYTPEFDNNTGIGCIEFVEWFNKGYSNGDIVMYQNDPCIVSGSSIDSVMIAVRFQNNEICPEMKFELGINEIHPASEENIQFVKQWLFKNGLQYCPEKYCLIERYIPFPGSRVVFNNADGKLYGIVREVDMLNNRVFMYCYWNYNTGEIFHSMHEEVKIEPTVEFEIMSAGMYRRFKSELGKIGFDWNDKVGRVEPVQGKVPIGKPYYHFSDKMKVCKSIEKGGRISHEHWLAGNYFWNINEALEAQGYISEYLRDRLAKTKREG